MNAIKLHLEVASLAFRHNAIRVGRDQLKIALGLANKEAPHMVPRILAAMSYARRIPLTQDYVA